MADKSDLIRELATSFGMADIHTSKYDGSKYDASTGTLYCGGITIPRHTIDKAIEYFERQMDYFRAKSNTDTNARDMFLINTVAYNSICMLKDNVNDEGKNAV